MKSKMQLVHYLLLSGLVEPKNKTFSIIGTNLSMCFPKLVRLFHVSIKPTPRSYLSLLPHPHRHSKDLWPLTLSITVARTRRATRTITARTEAPPNIPLGPQYRCCVYIQYYPAPCFYRAHRSIDATRLQVCATIPCSRPVAQFYH